MTPTTSYAIINFLINLLFCFSSFTKSISINNRKFAICVFVSMNLVQTSSQSKYRGHRKVVCSYVCARARAFTVSPSPQPVIISYSLIKYNFMKLEPVASINVVIILFCSLITLSVRVSLFLPSIYYG